VPHFHGLVFVDNTQNIERQDYKILGLDMETLEFFTPNTSYSMNLFGKCKKGPIDEESAKRRFGSLFNHTDLLKCAGRTTYEGKDVDLWEGPSGDAENSHLQLYADGDTPVHLNRTILGTGSALYTFTDYKQSVDPASIAIPDKCK